MPRLLSLNTYHYRRGGSDAVFFEHDHMFRELGWETAVMTMRHPKNEPSPWEPYFVDEIEFGHEYGFFDKLMMASKVVYSFEAKQNLSRLLERFHPDVAHVHCIYHHLSPSVLALLHERGIPVVLTAHDLKLACPAYKMLNRSGICERCKSGNLTHLLRYRCVRDSLATSALVMVESYVHRWLGLYRRNLDRIVVPSRFFQQKLGEWGWPEERLVYIPNFVHADIYEPQYRPGDYFLYFGRLAAEKGVATLIHAARLAGVRLRIAGTGPAEGALKTMAAKSGADVEFLGYQAGDALRTLIRNARAIVLPSELYENAPMSVLEAYASGKPVIGARIGGIPELIVEGETGELFASGDADSLAARLSDIQSAPDSKLADMGRTARLHVEQQYSLQRYRNNMLALYANLGVPIPREHMTGAESIDGITTHSQA